MVSVSVYKIEWSKSHDTRAIMFTYSCVSIWIGRVLTVPIVNWSDSVCLIDKCERHAISQMANGPNMNFNGIRRHKPKAVGYSNVIYRNSISFIIYSLILTISRSFSPSWITSCLLWLQVFPLPPEIIVSVSSFALSHFIFQASFGIFVFLLLFEIASSFWCCFWFFFFRLSAQNATIPRRILIQYWNRNGNKKELHSIFICYLLIVWIQNMFSVQCCCWDRFHSLFLLDVWCFLFFSRKKTLWSAIDDCRLTTIFSPCSHSSTRNFSCYCNLAQHPFVVIFILFDILTRLFFGTNNTESALELNTYRHQNHEREKTPNHSTFCKVNELCAMKIIMFSPIDCSIR